LFYKYTVKKEALTCTAWMGKDPAAVSPDSITQSVPSSTAVKQKKGKGEKRVRCKAGRSHPAPPLRVFDLKLLVVVVVVVVVGGGVEVLGIQGRGLEAAKRERM
jgi:hypothetical protein